jgi:hypothetical protein
LRDGRLGVKWVRAATDVLHHAPKLDDRRQQPARRQPRPGHPAAEHARQASDAAAPAGIVLTSNGDGISPDMRMFAPARGRVQLGLRRGGGGPARPRDVDREIIAVQSTLAKYHPPVSPAPSHLDDPSGASGRAAAILLASCVAFALALSCLAFHYLRLSEAYARLLWS